jgi:hypothetical protein
VIAGQLHVKPSDFPDIDMSQDELDRFIENIEPA